MEFTLKDYQEEAVVQILEQLKEAAERWQNKEYLSAISLTATTGAGKTVMLAAVLEALFYGNDNFDYEPDLGAVVIWFSDDPSLNVQSRGRLLEASDRLNPSNLEIVQNSFQRQSLEAGKVYFLNTQKLSKASLLVRGHEPGYPGAENIGGRQLMPDARALSIWDTIHNTIENTDLTLYLVLDEAHRGMNPASSNNEKPTIVKRLINGSGSVPGIPVVLGISATIERFKASIVDMQNRAELPSVTVDPKRVQDSGLLKDTIVLDVPDEAGHFDTVLVRRGTDQLKEITEAWEDYAKKQGQNEVVQPLMVLQIQNKPNPKDIGKLLDIIYERWSALSIESVAHVLGEHTTQTFGKYKVPYISPERVQESTWVRILIAKDAISSGWDCPRAEVMVSFRPAKDKTHIAQLLGRMVRSPLARRIPGNERLNSVNCLLPFFNSQAVQKVVASIMSGGEDGEELPGRSVLINPEEVKANPKIPKAVWNRLLSLPSQTPPKKYARPVKRLTILAHHLANDKLLTNAGKKAHAEMHKVLDAAEIRYGGEIATARNSVLEVKGKTYKKNFGVKEKMPFEYFVETADYDVIEGAYRRTARFISSDLARTYSEYLADKGEHADDEETALIDAHIQVAALGLVSDVIEYLENEANKLANKWIEKYRVEVKDLSDERQETYRGINEMSKEPRSSELARPTSRMQPTTLREGGAEEMLLPKFEKHLLCAKDGFFREHFNSWECKIVETELARKGAVGWYRNPPRTSQDSLGIVYYENSEPYIMRPDFIFFAQGHQNKIVADIVDPHGTYLADALPKLKGLADYAKTHGQHYRRIESVAEVDGVLKVIDHQNSSTRTIVESATSISSVWNSEASSNYIS